MHRDAMPGRSLLAERAGFEPARRGHRLLAFEASAFIHSATSPLGAPLVKKLPHDPATLRGENARYHLYLVI